MPLFTILFGIALMGIGVGTYVGSVEPSLSEFILQMILGLLALVLGVGSIVKKEMRMHFMHGAVLLAAMGLIVPAIRFAIYLFNLPQDEQMQLLRVVLTVAFSGAYLYTAIRSFRTARANRKNSTPAPPSAPEPPEPQPEPTDPA